MNALEFNPGQFRKSALPSESFAARFAPKLYPEGSASIPEKMRLESRRNIREFVTVMSKIYEGFQEPIVDVACGYRTNFSEATAFNSNNEISYIAFDHYIPENVEPYPPDFAASVYEIPLPDRSAGTVLCTETLEHLENPVAAIAELARILKTGGTLLITVPGRDIPIHEKYPFQDDFGRFSPEQLQQLLEQNGIGEISMERRWFEDEDGKIKEINLFAVGKKLDESSSLRRQPASNIVN